MRINFEQAIFYLKLTEMENIVKNYPLILKLGIETYWAQTKEQKQDYPDDYLDEERYMLQMFKYRMGLMTIVCLCETFEQFLLNLLSEKSIDCKNDKYDKFGKKFEKTFNVDLLNNETINEMRGLTNAIKHGDGDSFIKIRQKLGDDILANSSIYTIDDLGNTKAIKQNRHDHQTLTSITLNVEGRIQIYYEAIKELWDRIYLEL